MTVRPASCSAATCALRPPPCAGPRGSNRPAPFEPAPTVGLITNSLGGRSIGSPGSTQSVGTVGDAGLGQVAQIGLVGVPGQDRARVVQPRRRCAPSRRKPSRSACSPRSSGSRSARSRPSRRPGRPKHASRRRSTARPARRAAAAASSSPSGRADRSRARSRSPAPFGPPVILVTDAVANPTCGASRHAIVAIDATRQHQMWSACLR